MEEQIQQQSEKKEEKDVPALPAGSASAKDFDATSIFNPKTLASLKSWIGAAGKPSRRIDLSSDKSKWLKFDTTGLCYGIISKGDHPARIVPFVWQQDRATRRTWAVFDWNEFYGKPIPPFRPKIQVLLLPFDKSPDLCLYYGRGILAKFDEISESQISLLIHDSDSALKRRLEDRSFIAEDLQLYRTLQELSKPKYNWNQILMYLAIGAVGVVAAYMLITHPDLIGQIQHFVGLGQ